MQDNKGYKPDENTPAKSTTTGQANSNISGQASQAANTGIAAAKDKTNDALSTAKDTANDIGAQAKEYGQKFSDAASQARDKITDAASQAKDYMSDKVSVVGDKIKDLQNTDFGQVAEDAKTYARENPGQALLISAAAGFLIGLLIRGGSRR